MREERIAPALRWRGSDGSDGSDITDGAACAYAGGGERTVASSRGGGER